MKLEELKNTAQHNVVMVCSAVRKKSGIPVICRIFCMSNAVTKYLQYGSLNVLQGGNCVLK